MTIIEALKSAKDAGMMAYRRAWLEDPTLKDSAVVWSEQHGYCYWYKDAPIPEKYQDDDPRIGVCFDLVSITNVLAEDWEVEEPWRYAKPQ